MTDVIMPQMGESIAEGTVTKWMKNVGDMVERDEPLFEISTDKVDAEIPAPASGVLKEIRVQAGETVAINTVVAVIAAEGEAVATPPAPAATPTHAAPAAPPPAAPTPATPVAASAPVASPVPTHAPSMTPAAAPAPAPAAAPSATVPFQSSDPAPVVPAGPPPAPVAPSPQAAPPRAPAPTAPAPSPEPPIPMPPPAQPEASAAAPTPAAPAPPVAPLSPGPSAAPRQAAAATPPSPTSTPPLAPASRPAPTPGPPQDAATPAEQQRPEMTVEELRQTRSSPVVRKIAAEHQVDISQIPGTGISGRVTKQDILTHIESRAPEAATAGPTPIATAVPPVAAASPAAPPVPAESAKPVVPAYRPGERVEIVPMSPIRKRTAEHMVLSKRISAHVSTVWEIDMTRVDQLREKHRRAYEERSSIKLTYLPFIVKATIDALKAFPVLNSSVEGDAIVFKKDIHLGMAVALEWGLIVPVIRNADEKNLLGLAKAVYDLADRARTKKLKVEEVQGGTFTITNPGVFGSLFGTPIINQPQVAILGIGTIEKRPVVRDDAIAIRNMAYFALTFDHRIVDGADADRFMAHIKKGLQEFDEAAL